MGKHNGTDLAHAMALIPSGAFVLTAAYDSGRGAVLVKWVQSCSSHPPMVVVALPLGQSVEPLIRDSGCFALCQIAAGDRFLYRKLASPPPGRGDDPLVSIATKAAPSGSPIIDRALSYLDCELVRHLDIEADCALFIGLVRDGRVLHHEKPAIYFNGRRDQSSTPNGN